VLPPDGGKGEKERREKVGEEEERERMTCQWAPLFFMTNGPTYMFLIKCHLSATSRPD
jgi:hypothetical protein